MNISLLFFGATADIVGSRKIEIEHADGESLSSILEQLKEHNPGLRNHQLLVAVNEEYVKPDAILFAGDKVAIFTPVSGG